MIILAISPLSRTSYDRIQSESNDKLDYISFEVIGPHGLSTTI